MQLRDYLVGRLSYLHNIQAQTEGKLAQAEESARVCRTALAQLEGAIAELKSQLEGVEKAPALSLRPGARIGCISFQNSFLPRWLCQLT